MPAHALDDRCQQGTPPHRRLWGPLGKGGALCNRRSTTVPIRPPRPSSISHPEVARVTCSYIVHRLDRLAQVDSWLGQLGTRHDDDEAFRRGERMGRVGFDSRIFSPWMAGHPCLTLRARSLSLQGDPANIGKGCSRPACCTRGAGDRFGIPNPRKSGSVIGADRQRFGPSCVLLKRVPQGRTESG